MLNRSLQLVRLWISRQLFLYEYVSKFLDVLGNTKSYIVERLALIYSSLVSIRSRTRGTDRWAKFEALHCVSVSLRGVSSLWWCNFSASTNIH